MNFTTSPPVETTPVLLFRFTKSAPPDLITFVKERLTSTGELIILSEEHEENEPIVLGLTTTYNELELEAEQVHLVKPTLPSKTYGHISIMEEFTVETRDKFKVVEELRGREGAGFFTGADRAYLCWNMLDNIHILDQGEITNNLSRKLDEMKIDYIRNVRKTYPLGTTTEIPTDGPTSETLRHVLTENGLVDVICPLHNKVDMKKYFKDTLNPLTPLPIDELRNYYGEEIAFYFAWMDHITKALTVPALGGVVVFFLRKYRNDTYDNCQFTPFFGVLVFIWAILLFRFWERKEHRLSFSWGTYSFDGYSSRYSTKRPEFEGEMRISPITGLMEKYYSPHKRHLKYIVSALITLILLAVAFFVMIMSLNLQGYIHPSHDRERWTEDHHHPFHYPILAHLSDEGHLFDKASLWRCFIPTILHVLTIMTMNKIYRRIAERLTDWENHETFIAHENSLVLKRFLFEAFDAYVALFYLAFFEKDMKKLRSELVQVFNIDTFRRLLLEFVLPAILQKFGQKQVDQNRIRSRKKFDDPDPTVSYAPLTDQSNKDEYEQFDDYLEMVVELGYVCLFASAYPMAAVIAVIANQIEIRTDCMKLSRVCRRPRPIRTNSIGMWKLLISSIIWMSALTNCLIFGLTSQQLMQFLPNYFYLDEEGEQHFIAGKGWIVICIIFGAERVLLLMGIFLNLVVSSVPDDVRVKIERQDYVRMQEARNLRHQQRESMQMKEEDKQDLIAQFLEKDFTNITTNENDIVVGKNKGKVSMARSILSGVTGKS